VTDTAGSVERVMSEIEHNDPPREIVDPSRTPRAGELTSGWRAITALTWVFVMVALASVWKTSDQPGLSTWWLGPRGRPNSVLVQVLPFVPPVLMLLATLNHVRRLPWFGLAASLSIVVMGMFDLQPFVGLGVIEIAIGVAAAMVSLASLTGMYRPDSEPNAVPAATPVAPSLSS
jgi:hypothetical protein